MYTIEAIEANNRDVDDRAFQVVQTWKYACKKPCSVTAYKELTDAFSELGRTDLVELVRLGE